MKLNLTLFHFNELFLKGYDLNMVFMLKMIEEQIDLSALLNESAKMGSLKQTLIRKGLIFENEDKLTTLGKELLVFIDSKEEKKYVKKKVDVSDFSLWWEAFPLKDTFEYKGRSFTGCRSLRQNKDECRLKINKILLEGEYTITDLVNALKYDVIMKKEQSVKTGSNKLTYMQNSATYLGQRSYEVFIEEGRKLNETESKITVYNGTDI